MEYDFEHQRALNRLWKEAWPDGSRESRLVIGRLRRRDITPEVARTMSDSELMAVPYFGKRSVAYMRAAIGRQHCATCTYSVRKIPPDDFASRMDADGAMIDTWTNVP